LEMPGCLKDLVASCPTDDSCVYASSDAGSVVDICFASGVRASETSQSGAVPTVANVLKAGGSPCYSFAVDLGASDSSRYTTLLYTWRDAAGNIVATGSSSGMANPSHEITCLVGGEKTVCNGPVPRTSTCLIDDLGVTNGKGTINRCTRGICP
jgi:hypothetical protein